MPLIAESSRFRRKTHMKTFRKLDNSLVTNCLTKSTSPCRAPILARTLHKTCQTASLPLRITTRTKAPLFSLSCQSEEPCLCRNRRPSTQHSSSMSIWTRASKPKDKRPCQSSTKQICSGQTCWMHSMRMKNHLTELQ